MTASKITLRSVAGGLLILFACFAQEGRSQIASPDFQQFNDSFDPVFAVTSDRNGYIWAGTTHGLTRYDSHRSVTYTHESNNPASLCHNTVNTLLRVEDGNGGVLARHQPRTVPLRPRARQFQTPRCLRNAAHPRPAPAQRLAVGRLLLGTDAAHGVRGGTRKGPCRGGRQRAAHRLALPEADGALYFGSYNKIYQRTADGSVREIDIPFFDRWHSNLICDITSAGDGKGTLLLGTEYGLVRFNPATLETSIEFRTFPCAASCAAATAACGWEPTKASTSPVPTASGGTSCTSRATRPRSRTTSSRASTRTTAATSGSPPTTASA